MTKKAKIYLAVGMVLALLQLIWIVPGMKNIMIAIWGISWKALLIAFGLAVPIGFSLLILKGFEDNPWYAKLLLSIPAALLTMGINLGLSSLVFRYLIPSLQETNAATTIGWISLGIFPVMYFFTWFIREIS